MMKASDPKPLKPKTSYEGSRETSQKPTTASSKERQHDISPLKTEDSFGSARNSRPSAKNTTMTTATCEPAKTRGFMYSITSPTSFSANLNSFTSYRSNLNMHKSQDKRSTENLQQNGDIPSQNRKIAGKSSPHNRQQFYPSTREPITISPSKYISTHDSSKKTPVPDRQSRGSKHSNGLEEHSQDRKAQISKEPTEMTLKTIQATSAKYNSRQQQPAQQKLSAKGTAPPLAASPIRTQLTAHKLKGSAHKAKNEYLFSRLRANHLKNQGGDSQTEELCLSTSASQNYRQQQQESLLRRAASNLANNTNNSILGMSNISRAAVDSRNSKDNSFLLKDSSTLRLEERRNIPEKKESKSTDDLKSRYYQQKHSRPDPSFEINYLQSVRSVDFRPSPGPGEDNRTTMNNRTLSSTRLENMILEEKAKKEAAGLGGGAEIEDWKHLSEKTKKNFLNFHRIFTEDKRGSLGYDRHHNQLVSEIMKGNRSAEDIERTLKSKKPLELDLYATELAGMEKLVTPKLFNERSNEVDPALLRNQSGSPRGGVKTEHSVEDMYVRSYPKTTKYNNSNAKIELEQAQAFYAKMKRHDSIEAKMHHSRERSYESNPSLQASNKSLTMGQEKNKYGFIKKKSKTLLSNEIEERIGMLESSVRQTIKRSDSLKDNQSRTRKDTEVSSRMQTEGAEVRESFVHQPKIVGGGVNFESQLKSLYIKIKDGLERTRQENMTLIQEKRQLVDRIDMLEKRLSILEQKGAI